MGGRTSDGRPLPPARVPSSSAHGVRPAHPPDERRGPRGALLIGSPREVAEKIVFERERFGNERFLAQMSVGPIAHDRILCAIELFATEVVPAVGAAARVDAPS